MSDEMAGRTSYGSATKAKSKSGDAKGRQAGTGKVASGGAGSGVRKADDPAAWLRSPNRADASARARSYGGKGR